MAYRALLLLLLLPAISCAEDLTLEQAIQRTLNLQANIIVSKLSHDASKSSYQGTSGAFDNILSSKAQYSSEQTPLSSSQKELYKTDILKNEKQTYNVQLNKLFRSGLSLETLAQVDTDNDLSLGDPKNATSTVGISVNFPIFDFLMENQNTTNEKIALENTTSTLQDYFSQVSTSVFQTVVSYWAYLAAYERLSIYKTSVQNTQKMLNDFEKLIETGERPKADANQIKANLAFKQGRVVTGERDLATSSYDLAKVMGIPFESTLLPPPKVMWADVQEPAPSLIDQLINQAHTQRFEIKALESNIRSAMLLLNSSERGLKPDLDLFVSAYLSDKGRHVSEDIFDNAETVSAGIVFTQPLENSLAQSDVTQKQIAIRQLKISLADTKRKVSLDVATSMNNLTQSLKAYELSVETVALYEESLRVEVKKLKLGMSTVLDVINTHENLQTALISKVEDLRAVAVALAGVVYDSGGMINVNGDILTVNIPSLYTLNIQ